MSYWPPEVAHRAPPEFPPAWASAWGDDRYGLWADLTVHGHGLSATQRLRWIEPGSFKMGSTQDERDAMTNEDVGPWENTGESLKPNWVEIAAGYWLANTPCTQAFWQAVTGNNPSYHKDGIDPLSRPVEQVALADKNRAIDVQRFLQQLNTHLPVACADLPTETEWEYACRAGTSTAYWWGDAFAPGMANVNVTGNTEWDSKKGTTPVDQYPPNPWGLHDMHGNVWEWTRSFWRQYLDAPEETPRDTTLRVVRGGSCYGRPTYAIAAYRIVGIEGHSSSHQGFRFALRSSSPSQGIAGPD